MNGINLSNRVVQRFELVNIEIRNIRLLREEACSFWKWTRSLVNTLGESVNRVARTDRPVLIHHHVTSSGWIWNCVVPDWRWTYLPALFICCDIIIWQRIMSRAWEYIGSSRTGRSWPKFPTRILERPSNSRFLMLRENLT